jgi:hypothetical protein
MNDRAACNLMYGRSNAAPQVRTQPACLPQSGLSFSPLIQTASQRNFPPATCSPRPNWSHNPVQLSANDAQMHLRLETGAASTSSTTKISALSTRAANTHPNNAPTHRSIRVCKSRLAPASEREHPRQQDSIPSLLSVERCGRHHPTRTISRAASAQPQNCASASHLFAGSAHHAASSRRASQIASATPTRCDRPTSHLCFRCAHTANTAGRFPGTAC